MMLSPQLLSVILRANQKVFRLDSLFTEHTGTYSFFEASGDSELDRQLSCPCTFCEEKFKRREVIIADYSDGVISIKRA